MTAAGIAAVARQEFRLRIRAGRWKWLLGIWFLVLFAFTGLARLALGSIGTDDEDQRGTVMYGALMLFVLALALLVTPALSAQSVNGDRERGTLATLQVTRLTAGEIALGKFAAAWGTSLVFLALSLPMVAWTMAEGGVTLVRVLAVTATMAALLGTVCAVALGLSAVLARSTTSSVMSYLAVFGLGAGTLIVFGLATAMTSDTIERTQRYEEPLRWESDVRQDENGEWVDADGDPVPTTVRESTYTESVTHTERTWWLLAPNPFVVLADAAPVRSSGIVCNGDVCSDPVDDVDVLGTIGREVRDLRRGPETPDMPRGFSAYQPTDPVQAGQPGSEPDDLPGRPGPVWPWGLGANVLLGVAALYVTTRRLRTPSRNLPRGQRVA